MTLKQIPLYLRTVRYLKPAQLAYLVSRRMRPEMRVASSSSEVRLREDIRIAPVIQRATLSSNENCFNFLNVSRQFDPRHMDWACRDMAKLWRYNLHYFDYVRDVGQSPEIIGRLISDWIRQNPVGTEDAWEPYPVSLRIVNWIKFFLANDGDVSIEDDWLRSLYQQTLWLEKNIEYHLLANHYFKNAVALFFAGAFFSGRHPERWLRKGLKILSAETEEQFLPDGGHFERSLMYHSIALEDLLDVLNVILSNPGLVSKAVEEKFRAKAVAALGFLEKICYPDGEIPLFNDAAFGIAPKPSALFEYAKSLIDHKTSTDDHKLSLVEKRDSGYFGYRAGGDMLLVDCGRIGPDYQPGHAHCDTLSYELVIGGRRVVVDSGVHDYDIGALRDYVRSTAAHNTVRVDGAEQSEIWAGFRVGRRAYPLSAQLGCTQAQKVTFKGSHDGYCILDGKVRHERIIDCELHGRWTIEDRIHGSGEHVVESFIHVHPDFAVTVHGDELNLSAHDGSLVAKLTILSKCEVNVDKGVYCPEFGLRLENPVVRLAIRASLPTTLSYCIERA